MLELAYLKQASKLSTVLDFSGGGGHSVDHLERGERQEGKQLTTTKTALAKLTLLTPHFKLHVHLHVYVGQEMKQAHTTTTTTTRTALIMSEQQLALQLKTKDLEAFPCLSVSSGLHCCNIYSLYRHYDMLTQDPVTCPVNSSKWINLPPTSTVHFLHTVTCTYTWQCKAHNCPYFPIHSRVLALLTPRRNVP